MQIRGLGRKLRNDENSGLQLEYGMKERFKYLIRNLFLKLGKSRQIGYFQTLKRLIFNEFEKLNRLWHELPKFE